MTARSPLPAARIIRAISDAAKRFCNADFPPRVRATAQIRKRMGYSLPVIEYALDQLFAGCTELAVRTAVAREAGSLEILDGFIPSPGGGAITAEAAGPVLILSSRTTIGVALPSAVFALCAKAAVLVKDREDGLLQAFFATVTEEEPALTGSVAAAAWDGAGEVELDGFATVVAFGREETLAGIYRRMTPAQRFIGFGARISAGVVSLAYAGSHSGWCEQAARDTVLYEGEGCMSLRLIFVLTDEPKETAALEPVATALLNALETAAIEFPAADFAEAESLRYAQAQNSYRFAAAAAGAAYFAGPAGSIAVSAQLAPPLLPRSLLLVPVSRVEEIAAYLKAHALPLETLATAEGDLDQRDVTMIVAARYTRFGRMQQPVFSAPHDFRPRLTDFLRYRSLD